MKKALLVIVLTVVFLAPIAYSAPTVKVYDNMGRAWLADSATVATPGAGSGLGALLGLEADTQQAWERHMLDIVFNLEVTGTAADDSSGTERPITGVGIFWYANENIKFGPMLSWPTESRLDAEIPITAYLWNDPFSSVKFLFSFSAFTYTMRFETPDTPRSSAFSLKPKPSFGVEIPKGKYSVTAYLGAAYPFSIEGVDDNAINSLVGKTSLNAGVSLNWRLR